MKMVIQPAPILSRSSITLSCGPMRRATGCRGGSNDVRRGHGYFPYGRLMDFAAYQPRRYSVPRPRSDCTVARGSRTGMASATHRRGTHSFSDVGVLCLLAGGLTLAGLSAPGIGRGAIGRWYPQMAAPEGGGYRWREVSTAMEGSIALLQAAFKLAV